jgi:hypothetical protein
MVRFQKNLLLIPHHYFVYALYVAVVASRRSLLAEAPIQCKESPCEFSIEYVKRDAWFCDRPEVHGSVMCGLGLLTAMHVTLTRSASITPYKVMW